MTNDPPRSRASRSWRSLFAWINRSAAEGSATGPDPLSPTEVDRLASTWLLGTEQVQPGETGAAYLQRKREIVRVIGEIERDLQMAKIDVFSRRGAEAFDGAIGTVFVPSMLARRASRERQLIGPILPRRGSRELRRTQTRGGKPALDEAIALLTQVLHHPGSRAIVELHSDRAGRGYFHLFYRGETGLNTTCSLRQLAEIAARLPIDVALIEIQDTTIGRPNRTR